MSRFVPRHVAALHGSALVAVFLCMAVAGASAQEVIPIATIQNDAVAYLDSFVTIEGQVTIRTNFHPFATAGTNPGWIKDDSGRGIHLFGAGADNTALTNTGNIVRLRGEVQITGTTLGLTNLTDVTLQSSGNPRKTSIQLPTELAGDPSLDGTFLQINGTIQSSAFVSGGRNYVVDDGSSPIVVRQLSGVGSTTPIANGTQITALGVGFEQQVLLGEGSEMFADTPPADTDAPLLVGVWPTLARDSIVVTFNELVDATTSGTAGNYEVFETATPANTVSVSTASVSGALSTLQLAGVLQKGVAYSVRVSNVQDTSGNAIAAPLTLGFTTPLGDTTPPSLLSATNTSSTSIQATYSEAIDPVSGGDAANYEVFVTATPATTVPVSSVSVSGATATLTLGGTLAAGTGYTVRVQDIEDLEGNALVGTQSATFTTAPDVTSIADIQNNTAGYEGQVVTVRGQVYVPANYRQTVTSGYIQGSSGRGINLFGSGADTPLLNDTGNIVEVTGTVTLYFTTVEIENITSVTLVSSGNPELQPQVLSTGAAANSQWEGTYIQTTGTISAAAPGGPGMNYTINDGSGPIVVRVVDALGAPTFSVGQTITARGAGGQFGTDYQVNVGRASDVFTGGGGPDLDPPTLVSAAGTNASEIQVTFNEIVTMATAEVAGNYMVQPTAGGTALPVTSASLSVSGTTVSLALGSSMTSGTNYTVTVNNVQDEAGNTIIANSTIAFTYTEFTGTPIADIQANPTAFEGQVVTVQGQVYVPANYRQTVTSGYIQDSSGRGINLFGSGADTPLLNDTSNIVQVTGTVTIYFTTVEIENITSVTLVSSGNPELQPQVLSTGAAANSQWEGTYIQTTGTISSAAPGGPGMNYTINDGSGPIVVRVVDALGAPTFTTGQTITARGAGGQFSTDYQVNVGRAQDVFTGGGGPDLDPPTISSVFAPSETSVDVSWSEPVTTATANLTSNYEVYLTSSPGTTLPVTAAVTSGSRTSTTLTLGTALADGTNYTVRVNNIQDDAGNTIVANSTQAFTYSASSATPIADIQNNPSSYEGQTVTVRGQVFIPTNYIASRFSGYIQDDSNRGINLFGNGANDPALFNTSNIVEVTGTVALFFSTVEIENITQVTLLSTGNAELEPQVLSTGAAANAQWEGTYIQSTGTVQSIGTTGGSAPATNYTVDDGSGPLVFRVVDDINATAFTVGQKVTARGAGGAFQSDFQVHVGRASDIFLDTGGPGDLIPPVVLRARSTNGTDVVVDFSEQVTSATASNIANYEVFETGNAAVTIGIAGATLQSGGTSVSLALQSSLTNNLDYTVRVNNVEDLAGNPVAPNSVAIFRFARFTLAGEPYTFLPRRGETYPITFTVPEEIRTNGETLLRIYDMTGRLRRTLVDSRFLDANALPSVVEWDGRDERQELVPAGTYIAHLSIVDRTSGNRDDLQIAVVVATRLSR